MTARDISSDLTSLSTLRVDLNETIPVVYQTKEMACESEADTTNTTFTDISPNESGLDCSSVLISDVSGNITVPDDKEQVPVQGEYHFLLFIYNYKTLSSF